MNTVESPTSHLEKLPTNPVLERVAKVILEKSLQIKEGDRLMILMHPSGWQLATAITEQAKQMGAEVNISYHYPERAKIILEGLRRLPSEAEKIDPATLEDPQNFSAAFIHYGIGTDQLTDAAWGNKYLLIRNKIPSGQKYEIDPDDQKIYDQVEAAILRFRNDDPNKKYALIYEPDAVEAKLANMTLDEYRKVYYDAIDRPWDEVEKAQQVLIEFLATKKHFRVQAPAPANFPAGWDTGVSMSIEGMRGANSTIGSNLPGSEVFMAPVAGTLEGTYGVPYPVMFKDRIIPNIKFVFNKGRIASYEVFYAKPEDPQKQEDLAYIESILNTDDGARVVGELGIGTNPELNIPFLNSLLIEKVGGSIHLAIGNSYKNRPGEVIDNGNRSSVHIDITRVLLPEFGGGTISVDGEVIQQDGKFLIPGLEILNRQAE